MRVERVNYWRRQWPLYTMVLPGLLVIVVFSYLPMLGLIIAFQNFKPWTGFLNSQWVGLDNFKYFFEYPGGRQVIWNTLIISLLKVVIGSMVPIGFALLLNEVRKVAFKRMVQTMVYLPHFLSWVILAGILLDILSPKGLVNQFLGEFGISPIFFLGEGNWFRFTIVVSDIWKEFGFGTIVYLAALAGIDPSLYEAAEVDGASRWKQTMHITLPGIKPIIVLVVTLSLGNLFSANFDQIFNLYNPLVYEKADIIDTLVYRVGLIDTQYSFGAAVGMFKSVISFVLIVISYLISYRYANYRIF